MTHIVGSRTLLVIVSLCGIIAAATTAVTKDGRTVRLNEDGTWEYIDKADARGTASLSRGDEGAPGTGAADKDDAEAGASSARQRSLQQKDAHRETASVLTIVHNDGTHDFRRTSWGMTPSEVKQAEQRADFVRAEGDRLYYRDSLSGLHSSIVYVFSNNRLVKGFYQIEQTHLDPALFYNDFLKLAKEMRRLYGREQVRDYNWKNDTFKGNEDKYGFAISIGFLSCHYVWKKGDTSIDLTIRGKSHTFNTRITYAYTG
jgi:hypothetical protein